MRVGEPRSALILLCRTSKWRAYSCYFTVQIKKTITEKTRNRAHLDVSVDPCQLSNSNILGVTTHLICFTDNNITNTANEHIIRLRNCYEVHKILFIKRVCEDIHNSLDCPLICIDLSFHIT